MTFSMKITLENGTTVESSAETPQDTLALFDESMNRIKALRGLWHIENQTFYFFDISV